MIWDKTRTPKADWKIGRRFAYFPVEMSDMRTTVWLRSYWCLYYCYGSNRKAVCAKFLNETEARKELKSLGVE